MNRRDFKLKHVIPILSLGYYLLYGVGTFLLVNSVPFRVLTLQNTRSKTLSLLSLLFNCLSASKPSNHRSLVPLGRTWFSKLTLSVNSE